MEPPVRSAPLCWAKPPNPYAHRPTRPEIRLDQPVAQSAVPPITLSSTEGNRRASCAMGEAVVTLMVPPRESLPYDAPEGPRTASTRSDWTGCTKDRYWMGPER